MKVELHYSPRRPFSQFCEANARMPHLFFREGNLRIGKQSLSLRVPKRFAKATHREGRCEGMLPVYQDPQGVVNGHPLTAKGL